MNLFGQPSVLVDGRAQPLPPRERALAMLAYLALHPGPQSREAVAFALLPDEAEAAALASLRRQLLFIKKIIPIDDGRWLKAGFRTIAWDEDAEVDCDVRAFDRLYGGDEAEAAELYAGDLLPQLGDEWLAPFRRRYRERQTGLLIELARRAAARRAYEDAIDFARRALELDPWREDGLRLIMSARAAAGDRAGAIDEFARFSQMLKLELGVEPMHETRALSEALARDGGAATLQSKLPRRLDMLVGRDVELHAIRQSLREGRLVTLCGMGGIGKTSLALSTATAAEDHGTPVAFADFGEIGDGALVARTVAQAAGVKQTDGGGDAIAKVIGDAPYLLVLDTCEHVRAEAASLAAGLLRACANLTILATSREPLGTPGEFLYRVPALATPPAQTARAAEAGRYGAVALFCVRARAIDSDFTLTDANAEAVAELARRLDGLPLAIELAASRASLFSPNQMLARLDRRLRLLARTTGRQGTMREAIEWSYTLLSPDEQRVFRRIGIFESSFSLDAAGAVAASAGSDPWDVFGHLESLVSKSLVSVATKNEERRFVFLETIREFAREKLEAGGELDEAVRALLTHFLEFARELRRAREERTARDEIGRAMARESEGLRLAINLALREGREPQMGAEIVSLTVSHMRRHAAQEARAWCDLALNAQTPPQPHVRVRLLISRAFVSQAPAERGALAALAIREARIHGTPRDVADALQQGFWAHVKLGEYEQAEAAAREALAIRRAGGTPPEIALALDNLAAPLFNRGKLDEARACLEEAQRLDSNTISMRLMNLAEMEFAMGAIHDALRYGREVIPAIRAFNDRLNLALALCNLGAYEIRAQHSHVAREHLREALTIAREDGIEAHAAVAIQYLADVCASDGDLETAAELFGWSDRYFQEHGLGRETTERWMYDRTRRVLREQLEPLELERLLEVGRRFSAVHAVREAERVALRGRLASVDSA